MNGNPDTVPVQRWTITRSAGALHRDVLSHAGYDRRGTTSTRTDFLRRSVTFYAQRFLPPEERTLVVGFGLEWVGLPTDELPEWAHIGVGGSLREQYLQPTTAQHALDPSLVAGVAGPVLDHLERPSSPTQFIDQLLSYRGVAHPELFITVAPPVHSYCAAWGALLVRDAGRCSEGLAQAVRLVEEGPDGDDSDWVRRNQDWHAQQVALIDKVWLERHGEVRPEP